MIVLMTLLCHWLACFMKFFDEGFLSDYKDVGGSLWSEYLAAWYWSMTTLTTVGYGDITPSTNTERLLTIFAMVIGASFYGYVVGSIASIISSHDVNAAAFYERLGLVQAWMNHHRFPRSLRRSVKRYFKTYLGYQSAASEASIFQNLTPTLQMDVANHMISDDVKHNPAFDGLPPGAMVRLQFILRRVTVDPGNYITTAGQVGSTMYLIHAGRVDLRMRRAHALPVTEHHPMDSDHRFYVNRQLSEGESFGEEIIVGIVEHYAYTTKACDVVDLELIMVEEFMNCFNSMPTVISAIRRNVRDLSDLEDLMLYEVGEESSEVSQQNNVVTAALARLGSALDPKFESAV